ncbi:T9SS type A sorting domain-containing protein [Winogradskyella litorisediminis]|uniref:T9SS type A sorting domain-containing protein n=1 Tax=Winogradskyella litorisediminis TaxID=1156618 RepID=A0ABW3N248_9FLAO
MKKITIVFLFLCLTFSSFGQQLLSTRDQLFNFGTNTWEDNSGENYIYDSNGRLISRTELFFFNNVWEPTNRDVYTYNTSNTIETFQSYDSNSQTFINDFRTIYNYDSNGVIQNLVDENWNGTSWENDAIFIFNYVNNRLDTAIFQFWNGTTYVNEERNRLEYDVNNRLENLIFDDWTGNSWSLGGRERVEYDANGFINLSVVEDWNGTAYVEDERETFTYSASGNRLTEAITFNNITTTYDYTYDNNEQISNIDNPFIDLDGLTYQVQSFPFFNKVLMRENISFGNERTLYDYQNSIALNTELFQDESNLIVHPNPVYSTLNISSNSIISEVKIFDLLGKLVIETNETTIDVSNLYEGVYLLKISGDNKSSIRKFIKK